MFLNSGGNYYEAVANWGTLSPKNIRIGTRAVRTISGATMLAEITTRAFGCLFTAEFGFAGEMWFLEGDIGLSSYGAITGCILHRSYS